jgi:1,4-dihydroxy-2-naphthoate octaprenyltransferase
VRMTAAPADSSGLSRRAIWVHLLLYPTHTLPTAAAPVIVGVGLAVHSGKFVPLPAMLAFLSSWFIHIAGVFTDNHELLRRYPGVSEHPELVRALRDGTLKLGQLKAAIAVCLLLAVAPAPYFLRIGGPPVIAIGIIGALASLGYAAIPFAYTRVGLEDPVFFLMFGVVAPAATYYIQQPSFPPLIAFVIGLPVGALVTNVLLIDDLRDHEFDAAKGWRTGTVRFGVRWTRSEFTALMAFAYAAPFALWLAAGFGAGVLLPLVTLPFGWAITRTVRVSDARMPLAPMTARMSGLAMIYSVLFATGIACRS